MVNPTNDNTQPQTAPPSNEFWHAILQMYGTLRPGISQIRLSNEWDSTEIVGYISYDPTDDRFLLFDVDTDTVPQNTLAPIDAVINPSISGPGAGLPSAVVGQRYLILENMGESPAWGNCIAATNDIIEYTESGWQVAFSAGPHYNNTQFVTNLTTSIQYRWTGETWVKSYEGLYHGGEWSIVL